VPKERGYENFQNWANVLVERAVTTAAPASGMPWTFCLKQNVPPMDLSLPAEFDTEVSRRPLLIFDDFDSVTDEDLNFMSVVYDSADKNGILVFVLTSNRSAANRLLKLNHWRRVRPLDGAYDEGTKIELADGSFDDPQWIPMNWTVMQLVRLLACHGFADDEIEQVAPIGGENPYDVLLRTKRRFRRLHGPAHIL